MPSPILFNLYGALPAAGGRDLSPRDGIEDGRGTLLQALGVRFAPS